MTEADATRTSRRTALVAGGLGLAVLAGCGPQGEPGAAGGAPGGSATTTGGPAAPGGAAPRRLRIGTSFVVSNMVPGDNPQWHSTYGVAQTLYRILPEDKLAPWIASSIAPDGQEGYTIKLNPAARFHNGKRIDAAAVQACIERHLARGVQVPSLKGARWEVVDSGTLRVKTTEPDPWLPNYLATAASFPIFDVAEVPEGGDPSALVGKGFYSGPFRASALTADRLTLDAVPDAWDGAPKLAGVDVAFIRDPLARFNALKTG
ncbi:MAG TPA: ABC transporter substrate-binding protein, partial [Chloroflexota bacterium]|nr:ABC transporter substrate-binding protein [Chloroflexota bacterium]